ncbi:MAG TPA: hypothetical protein ENG68_03215 [bacterium]|nr:hypothetical protein [bacterium]
MSPALKIRIDRDNQLNVKKEGERSYRKIPGSFSTDEQNRLIYRVRGNPSWLLTEYRLKRKIIFSGQWDLDSEHQLLLKLRKSRRFQSQYLHLKGKILKAGADYLLFEINSRIREGFLRTTVLKLKGVWKNDIFNRLIFEVKRKTNPEVLVFRNAWRLTSNHQIEYIYQQKSTKIKNSLIFKGFWKLTGQDKLIYHLEGGESVFYFKAGLESLSLYPRKGRIKYRLAIGLRKQRQIKTLIFQGEFKISRTHRLNFYINYGDKVKRTRFIYELHKTKRGSWLLSLVDEKGKPIGLFITYRRNPFKGATYNYYATLGKRRGLEVRGGLRVEF